MPTKKATTSAKAAKKNTVAKGAAKKAAPKTPAKAKTKAKTSALDAASRVLRDNGGSMSTAELIEAMAAQKLWQSPNGRTPDATLYAALTREIATKGKDSRFQKTAPGRFAATGTAGQTEDTDGVPAPAPKAENRAKKTAEPATVTSPAETAPAV